MMTSSSITGEAIVPAKEQIPDWPTPAPEQKSVFSTKRYVLYVDVADLPKTKAEEYIKQMLGLFTSPNGSGVTWMSPGDSIVAIGRRNYPTELVEFTR